MILNLQEEKDVEKAKDKIAFFIRTGKTIDLVEKKNTRTTRQNSALYLMFSIMSNQLNEMGMEFQYLGIKGQVISLRYTPELVKTKIWAPIQKTLFETESTTKLNTGQINEIVEILGKFFSERGVFIEFPSKEALERLIND